MKKNRSSNFFKAGKLGFLIIIFAVSIVTAVMYLQQVSEPITQTAIQSTPRHELEPLGTTGTFGVTNAYNTGVAYDNSWRGVNGTPSNGNGRANYIKLRAAYASAGGPWRIKAALYTSANAYIATTEEKTIALTASYVWYQFNFSSPGPIVTNGVTYKIMSWCDDPAGGAGFARATSGGSGYFYRTATTYGAWPGTLLTLTYSTTADPSLYCSYTVNTNPTFSNPSPTNASTGVALTPQCAITLTDTESDPMTLTWQENSTGSYVTRQVNTSCTTGSTYRWTDAQATVNSHVYYWKVWCNDGIANVSAWYCFTTEAPSEILLGVCSPVNGSFNVALTGSFCILINETGGNAFNYSINVSNGLSSVATGSYNGTKCVSFDLNCGTVYTVWVNASNIYDTNKSWFQFETVECVYCTYQTYNYTNLSLYWWIDLSSDNGTFNWSIECSNGQNVSGVWDSNGTYGIFLYNLSYNTTYLLWVNCSTHLCGTNLSYDVKTGWDIDEGDFVMIAGLSLEPGTTFLMIWFFFMASVLFGKNKYVFMLSGLFMLLQLVVSATFIDPTVYGFFVVASVFIALIGFVRFINAILSDKEIK